ncbi:MAG: MmcQ/YjbR family DNA-binding protein [Pseudomonadota bacterium]
MTAEDFNRFCGSFAATSHVVQWGGANVWKVGGKVFAVGGWQDAGAPLAVTFKCSEMGYEILRDTPGCRPAPYLASRGMKWIQRYEASGIDDAGLRDYVSESYRLVALGLSKKKRIELGIEVE